MPTSSTAPILPVELLQTIFNHLRPHDIAQVCKANSHLRHVARPLFYRFGTFTKFGLHFPGALSPYPFLDVPEIGVTALDASSRGRLLSKCKQLTIPPHTPSECAIFRNLELNESPTKIEVLRIECAVRIMEDGWVYPTGDFPHTEAYPATTQEDDGNGCHHCKFPCFFMKPLLSSLQADKVVLRDPALGLRDVWDDCLPSFQPAKEFFAVLHSEPISDGIGYVMSCETISWGIRPYWSAPLVTIVMWTGSPANTEWLPPCMNPNLYIDSHYDPHTPGTDSDLEDMEWPCYAADKLWSSTGRHLARAGNRCNTLRIVNATATIAFYKFGKDGEYSSKQQCDTSDIERTIRAGARHYFRNKKDKKWTGVIQFLSMEEWVALGEWEDVFTRKEIAPFLAEKQAAATPLTKA